MRPKALIFGGSGLLGLRWAMELSDRYDVTIGYHSRRVDVPGIRSVNTDMLSVASIETAIRNAKADLVINCVGLTSVEKCEAQPEQADRINALVARDIALACAATGAELVHVSTDHLFDGASSMVGEDQPVSPLNVYGKTKARAETLVLDANPRALILRCNFFHWGPSFRPSFSDWIIQNLRAQADLTLFSDVYFTPIHTRTLVQVSRDLLELKASGIFHTVGNLRLSKGDFGRAIANCFALPMTSIIDKPLSDFDLVRRPQDMSLSNQKLTQTLGRRLPDLTADLAFLRDEETAPSNRKIQSL